MSAGAILLALLACRGAAPPAEERYRQAIGHLERGDLVLAEQEAVAGREDARRAGDGVWRWAFQVIEAEVLAAQRKVASAREQLQALADPPGAPAAFLSRARTARGYARCLEATNADEHAAAQVDLAEGVRLSAGGPPALQGHARFRDATCALIRRDHATAGERFHALLGWARTHGLPVLEANSTGSLGLLSMRADRYDEAVDWFTRSEAAARAAGLDGALIKTRINLAWAYSTLGNYERALRTLREAEPLAVARAAHGDLQVLLEQIGNAHLRRGEHGEAKAAYERALVVARDQKNQRLQGELTANLARVAFESGRLAEARARTEEALVIKRAAGDHRAELHSLFTLARIHGAEGDTAGAESLYSKVIGSDAADQELRWRCRADRATLLFERGDGQAARAEFRRAIEDVEEFKRTLRHGEDRVTFLSSLMKVQDDYVSCLVADGDDARALAVADRSRARVLSERMGTAAETEVAPASLQGRSGGAVVLSYWLSSAKSGSYVWVVTPRGLHRRGLPAQAEIERRVARHQAAIEKSRDLLADASADGQWLYEALVPPEVRSLPLGSRVVVIPDGVLHGLSFETLIAPSRAGARPRRFWIEDVVVAYAPSLGLMSPPSGQRAGAPEILVVGDPVAADEGFPPLRGTREEVRGICRAFTGVACETLTGAEATPGAFRRARPERFSLIHFAAHAVANRESPLDSAVILSPEGESYKLYARDIPARSLQADLVTLSGCRSAGAREYAGEGLVGFAWAFFSAGARNVLAGLWNVDDAATARLMTALYGHLGEGRGAEEALREAKLSLLRSATPYRKPYYWAPFVIYTRDARPSSAVTVSPVTTPL